MCRERGARKNDVFMMVDTRLRRWDSSNARNSPKYGYSFEACQPFNVTLALKDVGHELFALQVLNIGLQKF